MNNIKLLLTVLILLVLSSCKTERKSQNAQKPNIILFLVDDLGWQDTSEPFWMDTTPNNRKFHTPNMERLADQGMKFTQAYACAVCSPTRVSLLSGMNAARHRVTNWTLRRGKNSVREPENLSIPKWNLNGVQAVDSIERSIYVTPLPQILKDNYYFTIHCGKAHFGSISTPGENPLNLGFDLNIAGHAAGAPGSYHGINNFSSKWRGGGNTWDVPGLEKYHGKNINLTEALTREAILAMDSSLSLNKPFYLYMAHYGVHTPLEPDDRFYQKYKDRGLSEPEARYASMVESVDKSLGDLMNYLEEKGIANNTIVMFMSDNGGLSAVARGGEAHTHNKPLSSGKGSAHEGGIREPMIVKWPGEVKPNSQCNEYLIIEDFFPTILQMAGIDDYKTVQHVDGKSFLPMLKQQGTTADNRALFWHYPNNWGPTGPGIGASSTIRLGDWKLIYYHSDRSFELFNIAEDIGETNNLEKTQQNKLKELAGKLTDYLKSVDAQMPTDKTTGKIIEWPIDIINQNQEVVKIKKKKIITNQIYTDSNNVDLKNLSKLLDGIQASNLIGIVPLQNYPYKPEVKFKIVYTDDEILLKVNVNENYIRAKYNQANDPVYRDSCFEFFISLDNDDTYYNFEFNCIGNCYLAYGEPGDNREEAEVKVIKSIRTLSSLGNQTFEEKKGDFEWEMTIAIPLTAFYKHDLKTLKGKTCHANFYKCGDELTKPHFLAWNHVQTENPDFHQPEFFGEIDFR